MIEVLIGMIASGKSAYAKQRAREGWIIINDDAIVNLVHGGDYTLYDKSLKSLYKSVEDNILHTAIAMNKSICIDRGVDIRASSRARWISLARCLDVPIRAISFKVCQPEVHANRRMQDNDRGHDYTYWLRVAQAHASSYNPPTLQEGFAEVINYDL